MRCNFIAFLIRNADVNALVFFVILSKGEENYLKFFHWGRYLVKCFYGQKIVLNNVMPALCVPYRWKSYSSLNLNQLYVHPQNTTRNKLFKPPHFEPCTAKHFWFSAVS